MSDGYDDLKLILDIVAHGGRKNTSGKIDRTGYQRLVDFGWLTPFITNASDVEYVVTDLGKVAAQKAALAADHPSLTLVVESLVKEYLHEQKVLK